jgi:hypothetical protein
MESGKDWISPNITKIPIIVYDICKPPNFSEVSLQQDNALG